MTMGATRSRGLIGAAALTLLTPAMALDFSLQKTAEGKAITVCHIDPSQQRLQLFLQDEKGGPVKRLQTLEKQLATKGQKLVLGMNAGMYHGDLRPVGLCVIDGKQLAPLNQDNAPPERANPPDNFFRKPNGVFAIDTQGKAMVVETTRYAAAKVQARIATQSGPMLVIDGKIHQDFQEASKNRVLRNAVGVDAAGQVLLVITEQPVNFYDLALFMRDTLHCPNALFLDGTVCSMLAPELKRSDARMDLGPIFGLTAPH